MPATVSHTARTFPFGEEMAAQHAGGAYATRYKFNGKELDPETGYYYYGARYYDPVVSRWLSVDPLAEKYPGLSPYNYTANNPVMLVDPDGKRTEPPVNGLDWFADDTGEYFWNEEMQLYEHYAYDESNNSVFVGYYSADEFAEPVGDYDIIFDLSNIEPKDEYNPEHTISSLATPLIEYLEASDGNPFNKSEFKDISDPDKYPGVKILSHPNMNGAITLGNLIITNPNMEDKNTLDHEYGHYLDFKYHFKYNKLAYLTTIGLPSLVSAIINDAESHLNSISERRANRLGGAWSDNNNLKNKYRNVR